MLRINTSLLVELYLLVKFIFNQKKWFSTTNMTAYPFDKNRGICFLKFFSLKTPAYF